MLDSKIKKIQSCEHIQVPGGLDKQGPTILTAVIYKEQGQTPLICSTSSSSYNFKQQAITL